MDLSAPTATFVPPRPTDGLSMHAVAEAAGGLDVNPPYAYALWARDFADTSVVVLVDDEVVAYTTGYRRPSAPDTLFVWQVAVHPEHRGQRLAVQMLHALADRAPAARWVEATVTADNAASLTTFGRFAADRGVAVTSTPLFTHEHLPSEHEPEDLLRIGPLTAG